MTLSSYIVFVYSFSSLFCTFMCKCVCVHVCNVHVCGFVCILWFLRELKFCLHIDLIYFSLSVFLGFVFVIAFVNGTFSPVDHPIWYVCMYKDWHCMLLFYPSTLQSSLINRILKKLFPCSFSRYIIISLANDDNLTFFPFLYPSLFVLLNCVGWYL